MFAMVFESSRVLVFRTSVQHLVEQLGRVGEVQVVLVDIVLLAYDVKSQVTIN